MNLIINKFPGIAPAIRSAAQGQITRATTALDVDLGGGTLRGVRANTQTALGHSGPRFTKYLDNWVSGLENPINWMYDTAEVLIYKESGTWKKKVGGTVANLGLTRPASPVLVDISIPEPPVSPSTIDEEIDHPNGLYLNYGQYVYAISFSKVVAGVEVEGPLSAGMATSQYFAPVEVASTHPNASYDSVTQKYYDTTASQIRYHVIHRPTAPAGVTHWTVYRSDNGSTPRMLAQGTATGAGEGFDTITDTAPTEALGRLFTGRPEDGEKYQWGYVITWERPVGVMIDESGPSDPVTLVTNTAGATITRPTSYPSGVTYWNIYRISNGYIPTTDYDLVAHVPIATQSYSDTKSSEDLGDAIPTAYKLSTGENVIFDTLPLAFDGMCGQHNGMFFAWKDAVLYASEPGLPDVWPYQYKWTLPAPILACVSMGSELAIMTTEGIHRGIGSDPSGFYNTASLATPGLTAPLAQVNTEMGMFYLSYAGLVQVSGGVGSVISETVLGADFFASYTMDTAFMIYHNGLLYMFFAEGTVVFDVRGRNYTTLTIICTAAFVDPSTGKLQVLVSGGIIEEMGGSASVLSYTYQTGDIVLGQPDIKTINEVEVFGTGQVEATIYLDGHEKAGKSLDLDGTFRQRTIKIKANTWGRAVQVQISGPGEVKEVRINLEKASD